MAQDNRSTMRITTGQLDFSGGVDSNKTPTLASDANPYGLKANQLAWLVNATVRGGGVERRAGWVRRGVFPKVGWFQEAAMYTPDFANPYLIAQIGGRTFRMRVDTDYSVDELTIPGDPNPPDPEKAWMCQAEMFMVIQDGVSVPLVWDGVQLQRVTSMLNASPKIPTGQAMDYYMGRIWIANGREYMAGDIVFGASGTAAYGRRDSVLSSVENTYLSGGGSFITPTNAGNIRALAHSANLDSALGEGLLFVFTRQTIYAVNVPQKRSEWVAINNNDGITIRVANIVYGATSDRSVVPVNGDLFFQSPDGVRSLSVAIRYFQQWGNVPISVEEARVLNVSNREFSQFGSGIEFDNRLLQTCLPELSDIGVIHKGVMPLDFNLISTLAERLPPAWEGVLEGLDILRLVRADFGGLQRAFALVRGKTTGAVEVWELTLTEAEDDNVHGTSRITWVIETPSFTWGNPFALKQLDTLELWLDRLFGTVNFALFYRPSQSACWEFWHYWTECATRNRCEEECVTGPERCDYPTQTYRPQYRSTLMMPRPPAPCNLSSGRPSDTDYAFQFRLVIKGSCRIRGLLAHAFPRDKAPYEGLVCNTSPAPIPCSMPPLPPMICEGSNYFGPIAIGRTVELVDGALPPGLTLENGIISGVPTMSGSFSFSLRAQIQGVVWSYGEYTIVVRGITTSSLPDAALDAPYTATLTSSYPVYLWTIIIGSLPPGITLDSSSGIISGTPTEAGTYAFTVEDGTCSRALSIIVRNLAPIEWWKMEEDGMDRVGSLHGTILAQSDAIGSNTGLILDGAEFDPEAPLGSRFLATGLVSTLATFGLGFSIVGWIKRVASDLDNDNLEVVFQTSPATSVGIKFFNTFTLQAQGNVGSDSASTTDPFPIGDWVFVNLYFDSVTRKVGFSYNDGTPLELGVDFTFDPAATGNLIIGYDAGQGAGPYTTMFDEWGIYPRKLTYPEVTDLYNAGAGRTFPP